MAFVDNNDRIDVEDIKEYSMDQNSEDVIEEIKCDQEEIDIEEDLMVDDEEQFSRTIKEKGSKKVFNIFNKEKVKLKDQISKLKTEIKLAEDIKKRAINESSAFKERLTSLTNEYENYRNRTAKEKEAIYDSSLEEVLKEMLPILDNLYRAIDAAGDNEAIKSGLLMLERQFENALTKLGVETIDTLGEFDPELHSAVMHIEDETMSKNSIVEVFQKGYRKENKILRHSMVKVAN